MSYHLIEALDKKAKVDKIAWGRSQLLLPIFLFKAAIMIFLNLYIRRRKYDVVLLGDASLSILGSFLKKLIHKPAVCVAHGLDVTFPKAFYQNTAITNLRKMDLVVCVSRHTRDECISRGVDASKIRVIPNGIEDVFPVERKLARYELEKAGIVIPQSKVLLTVGRLIMRKGLAEFIENAFISLAKRDPDIIYIVAGAGPEMAKIRGIVQKNGLNGRVLLLGRVDDDMLDHLYAVSDIFIMPNIEVKGDAEGFGIVALEASSRGVPVIASNIEGIRDAVKEGENGLLVEPMQYELFTQKILDILDDKKILAEMSEKAKKFAAGFSWDGIADRYLEAVNSCLGDRPSDG